MTRWAPKIDAIRVWPYSRPFSPAFMQVYGSRTRPADARLTRFV
jgi:hypothetical protein